MAVKVIVPNINYNEFYFGVQFKDGVAIFEDEAEARKIAARLDYIVEPIEAEKPKAKPKTKAKKTPTKKEG